jgi:hypothetical protein
VIAELTTERAAAVESTGGRSAKGASGREMALRFNRSVIGLALVTLVAMLFLLP